MQAVIAYEKKYFTEEEKTGYIPPKAHTHCGSRTDESSAIANDKEQLLKFK